MDGNELAYRIPKAHHTLDRFFDEGRKTLPPCSRKNLEEMRGIWTETPFIWREIH